MDLEGIIIGKTNLPLVHEGEALFHIAMVNQPETTTRSVEVFRNEYAPLNDEN